MADGEVRGRSRGTRWVPVAGLVVVVAVVAVLVVRSRSHGTDRVTAVVPRASVASTSVAAQPTSTAAATTSSLSHPDFSAFVGHWFFHGFDATIGADGTGSATWRVYRWCTDNPAPPCDRMVGDQIVPGGSADFRLTRAGGTDAAGQVTRTTDPTTVPSGSLTLHLVPGGSLQFPNFPEALCGPSSPVTSCGA